MTIPYSTSLRRRMVRGFAFHPAGDAAPASPVAPGAYTLLLTHRTRLVDALARQFSVDANTLRSATDGALQQLGVGARTAGAARFDVQSGGVERLSTWAVPVQVTAATTQALLHRALARAAFHASQFPGKDPADGGASFVSGGDFSFSMLAHAPSPTPSRPDTPAAPPPSTFTGKPEAQLTRNEITRYQQMLTRAGYDTRGSDGLIGTNTRSAVRAFQSRNGLSADGILGPQTQAALERARPGTPAAPATPTPTRPAPTPTPAAPTPTTPPTAPPSPTRRASMSTGTVLVASVVAAAIGAGIAFRDKLFSSRRRAGRPALKKAARG